MPAVLSMLQNAINGPSMVVFAQSLLMEAHDRGLGTCPLNCSLEPKGKVKEIIGAIFPRDLFA